VFISFTEEEQMAIKIPPFLKISVTAGFSFFERLTSKFKPPLLALVLCFERSDGKEHFQKHSGLLRTGSGATKFCKIEACVDASFTLL